MEITAKVKNFLSHYSIPITIFLISKIIIFLIILLVKLYDVDQSANLIQWDAPHYLSIAQYGYQVTGNFLDDGSNIAFFPLYPILISVAHFIFNLSYEYAGIAVSCISSLFAFIFLYKIVLTWKDKEAATSAVFLLAFYPSAVFFTSAYTESLFLLLVVLTFYFLQKDKLNLPIITVGLACITRITGVILAIIFLWIVWQKTKSIFKVFYSGLCISIPFLMYLYFQYVHYNTPFAFLIAQQEKWQHHAVAPWNGLWNFIYTMFTYHQYTVMWYTDGFFLLLMILTLVLSFRKIPHSIWVFGFGIVVLTLSSNFILSINRYMIMVLPFYFYWGHVLSKKKFAFQIVLAVSSCWMVLNTIFFVTQKYLL